MAENNGGNGKMAGEVAQMQERYVEARVQGALQGRPASEALREAGYSGDTRENKILAPGSAAERRMQKALQDRGIDEGWLLDKHQRLQSEIEKGNEAYAKGAMAVVQSLREIAKLLGHGHKPVPAVAVQINNAAPGAPGQLDPGTVARLAELVGEELSRREPGEVSGGASGDPGL